MPFLHKRMHLTAGDTVVVDCGRPCNVLMMTKMNFNHYRKGMPFRTHGGSGFFHELPARMVVPFDADWNITLDIEEGALTVEHSITVEPGADKAIARK